MINYSQYMKDRNIQDHSGDALRYFVNTLYSKSKIKNDVDDKLKISFNDAVINAKIKNPIPKHIGTYIEF